MSPPRGGDSWKWSETENQSKPFASANFHSLRISASGPPMWPMWIPNFMSAPPTEGFVARSAERVGVDRRDVRADHLPSFREAHPGLALPADLILAAYLVLEIHGGDVASQRQDLEPSSRLLGAGAEGSAHPMGVNLVEAVAVLGVREADRVGAVPERAVEDLDVLVDQRLLVALDPLPHLGDDLAAIGRQIGHRVSPIA